MNTQTDTKTETSWFRRFFGKAAPVAPEVPVAAVAAPEASKKPARNQKVLVVDDDPLFLKLTSTQLENEGYDVLTAKDGCEAIEAVRKQKPNLMVLDVNLPQDVAGVPWDGYRVISWLNHFESVKNIPVVMTTAGDPQTNTRLAMKSGATAFFHKRMNRDHLVTLVNHGLLRGSKASEGKDDSSFQI